jgi:hypothetical protein
MSTAEERLARQIKTARDLAEANRCADRVLARAKAHARRKGEREPRSTGPTKADRKAAKREETADLRARLVAFADERCERCGTFLPPALGHMHHTRGGSGRRLAEQAFANVAWICGGCHEKLHQNPAWARKFRAQIEAAHAEVTP